MEGNDSEKIKAKPEADYSFDPISATSAEWKKYLLNSKNFEKDFTQGEYPFKTPAETILGKLQEAGSPRSAVETAVQVILDNWNEFVSQKGFLIEINPIEFVATLANEDSIDIVKKLWSEVSEDSTRPQRGLLHVAEGLGVNLPLNQEELENLYKEQFNLYAFTALEIMLKRGEVERASILFEEHVDQYPKGNDPVMLDYLVGLGLPSSSAKKWLDQSVNAGEGYKEFYREALERWGYKSEV